MKSKLLVFQKQLVVRRGPGSISDTTCTNLTALVVFRSPAGCNLCCDVGTVSCWIQMPISRFRKHYLILSIILPTIDGWNTVKETGSLSWQTQVLLSSSGLKAGTSRRCHYLQLICVCAATLLFNFKHSCRTSCKIPRQGYLCYTVILRCSEKDFSLHQPSLQMVVFWSLETVFQRAFPSSPFLFGRAPFQLCVNLSISLKAQGSSASQIG